MSPFVFCFRESERAIAPSWHPRASAYAAGSTLDPCGKEKPSAVSEISPEAAKGFGLERDARLADDRMGGCGLVS